MMEIRLSSFPVRIGSRSREVGYVSSCTHGAADTSYLRKATWLRSAAGDNDNLMSEQERFERAIARELAGHQYE